MRVTVNGQEQELAEGTPLSSYLEFRGLDPSVIVVEYNFQILPEQDWEGIILKENDNLEILRFVGGG